MPENTAIAKREIAISQTGLQLATLSDAYRFAECVIRSGLAPKGIDRPESALVAIQMGWELGLQPMAAIRNIAVINGRPSVWGDAALAIVTQSPQFHDIEETIEGDGDKAVAICRVWETGKERPVERRFSWADAKQAGLLGKPGPWQQYPQRMLQMRARSWALRDAFPGALSGLMTTEEAQDVLEDRTPRRVDGEVVETAQDISEAIPTPWQDDTEPEAPEVTEPEAVEAEAVPVGPETPTAEALAEHPEVVAALRAAKYSRGRAGSLIEAAEAKGWGPRDVVDYLSDQSQSQGQPKPKTQPVAQDEIDF